MRNEDIPDETFEELVEQSDCESDAVLEEFEGEIEKWRETFEAASFVYGLYLDFTKNKITARELFDQLDEYGDEYGWGYIE